ncbi:MAG: response regulator [Candidatus Zixiibacteriota bacterium]
MGRKTRILVVDDDPLLTSLLSDTLESIGYETLSVDSGETAVEMVGSTDVDIIVADINLPGIDGIEAMRRIKRISPTTPVILITGVNMKGIVSRAFSAGADGFLDKPFRIAVIEKMIQELLGHLSPESSAVMVIDDDEESRELLQSQLREQGYDVSTAASGTEALLKLRDGHVSIVLTDFIMPGMSGIELAHCIKEFSPTTNVVIYTGFSPNKREKSEIAAAADAFLAKPFRFEQVTEILARFKTKREAIPSTIVGL